MKNREYLEALAKKTSEDLKEKIGPNAKVLIALGDEDSVKSEMGISYTGGLGYQALGFIHKAYHLIVNGMTK